MAAALLVCLRGTAHASSSTQPFSLPEASTAAIRYKADTFDYVRSTSAAEGEESTMHLKGHVWVKDSTWTLLAGDLWLDLDSRQGEAFEGFTLDDEQTLLSGESGDFDFEDHTGSVANARGEYPPWRIWSRQARLDELRRAHFRRAYFTSCNYEPPHYHFWAYRLHVRPQHWLYATNVFFLVGKIPLFYTPFLWKSLNPEPFLHTRVVPGYDKRYGGTLRSTTLFSVSSAMYGRLFVDHYGKERPGFGGELIYNTPEGSRGTFYGYRILERTGRERWTATGDLYQTLGHGFALQGRLQRQSDTDFNNDYLRSNSFRVTTQLINSGAVVYQTRRTTTHIAYSREDDQDPNSLNLPPDNPGHGRYAYANENFPHLDWSTTSLSWKRLPLLYTFSGFADNVRMPSTNFVQRTAGGSMGATQTYHLGKNLVFTPAGSFSETYANRQDAATSSLSSPLTPPITVHDAVTARYQLGGNLRSVTSFGALDLNHSYVRRFKIGTLREDVGAPDYGLEANTLSLQDTLRPNRYTLVRIGSAYDFRVYRDQLINFHDRFSPFIADLSLTPGHQLQFTIRDVYNLGYGNQNFLMQTDWGDRLGYFVGFGIIHTLTRSPVDLVKQYITATDFGLGSSSSTWRILGTLRYTANVPAGLISANTLTVFEKELSIRKKFHDFEVRIIMRVRPVDARDFLVRIDMPFGQKTAEDRIVRKDWESEWYPWRKEKEEDR